MAFENINHLTSEEIEVLNTLANYEPMSVDLFNNISVLLLLEQKGLIEKIHQDFANITRYRLTDLGRTEYQNIDLIYV